MVTVKKVKKLLNKRVKVGKALLIGAGTLLAAFLTLGAASPNSPQYVAHVASLRPEPIVSQSPQVIVKETVVPNTPPAPEPVSTTLSVGGSGRILPGNNCVICARALTGRGQNGNAGSWRSNDSHPDVGDIMIFRAGQQGAGPQGHVGVVVGVHGNKVSLAHCNWPGQTEFFSTGLFY